MGSMCDLRGVKACGVLDCGDEEPPSMLGGYAGDPFFGGAVILVLVGVVVA